MNVRRNLLLLSFLLLNVALWLGGSRILFLAQAERAVGVVVDVQSENARCGRKRCTKFSALVRFQAASTEAWKSVAAGRARRYDQPVTLANYKVGDSVPMLFDPVHPEEAIRDHFWDKWGATGSVLLIGSLTFAGFLREEDTGQIISMELSKPS